MCRNIKTLFNFEPPASNEEIQASSVQFVRKLSGFTKPSQANQAVFDQAIIEVQAAAKKLIDGLVTNTTPRSREIEEAKARERAQKRFASA